MFQRKLLLPGEVEFKAGDILGFSGYTWISAAINIATYGIPFWDISHVGILGNCPDGQLRLFESTTLDGNIPCEITGKAISGTQAHDIHEQIKRYRGKVYHYPLYRELYPQEDERLTEFLMETIGVPYDEMGAFRSAGVGLSWIESLFRPQNLHTIFCSEWCAAAYAVLGIHPTDHVSRWNPNRLCRHLRLHGILCKPRRLK
ncbi:MAG: hypothetical protein ABFC88_12950 [Thermoguttaceae bacterium]